MGKGNQVDLPEMRGLQTWTPQHPGKQSHLWKGGGSCGLMQLAALQVGLACTSWKSHRELGGRFPSATECLHSSNGKSYLPYLQVKDCLIQTRPAEPGTLMVRLDKVCAAAALLRHSGPELGPAEWSEVRHPCKS